MTHYHSADQLAEKAGQSGRNGDCARALDYYHSAGLQFGQGLGHEQSGGGFEVGARKKTAGTSMRSADRALRMFCLKKGRS